MIGRVRETGAVSTSSSGSPRHPCGGYGLPHRRVWCRTIRGKRVFVVEDGPSLTRGGTKYHATPIDLTRVIHPDKPLLRVGYELQEIGQPTLESILKERFSLTPAVAG